MDYEKNAIEILRIIGSNSGFTVADSGGKDSSVLTHIAMKAGCPFEVVHNHTTVDAPETVYFIREKFKKLRAAGIKAEIVMPKETMWQLIVRKKTPPTRLIRYCCSELKESYGAGKKMVTGVRKAESVNRAKNQGVVTFPKPHKIHGTQREQQTASQPEAGMCLSDVRNILPTGKETGTLRKNGA